MAALKVGCEDCGDTHGVKPLIITVPGPKHPVLMRWLCLPCRSDSIQRLVRQPKGEERSA